MAQYVCSVCGFVYDEAKGIPEAGIAPGTSWEELPEDWVCPLCGAAKSEFEKQGEPAASPKKEPISVMESSADMKEMSPLELSALCSNLARGCEKQYKPEEAALFTELAELKCSGNKKMVELYKSINPFLYSNFIFRKQSRHKDLEGVDEHKKILSAIQARDEPLLRSLLTEHINNAIKSITLLIRTENML